MTPAHLDALLPDVETPHRLEYRVIGERGGCSTDYDTLASALHELQRRNRVLKGLGPHRLQRREVGPWEDVPEPSPDPELFG